MKGKNKILKVAAVAPMLLLSIASFGKEATTKSSGIDPLWGIVIAVMAILLLVILLLGNTLLSLAKLVVEKRKKIAATSIILLLLSTLSLSAQEVQAITPPANSFNIDWNWVLAGIVLLAEGIVIAFFSWHIHSMLDFLSDEKKEKKPVEIHFPRLFDTINASVSIEREAEVMTDHEYDGIRELDNNLPPWWKYGFYVTIVYAVVYLFYFHVYGAPSSTEAYATEMENAKIAKEEYLRKNALNVDETNVKMSEAPGIVEGKTIFDNNCAACHGKIGEGGVGPNLTDNYWMHGGSLNEVFKSVKYGWPAKGMKSWQTDLSGIQMRDVSSYIMSLAGTNPPGGKAPQGELIMEAAVAKTDTLIKN